MSVVRFGPSQLEGLKRHLDLLLRLLRHLQWLLDAYQVDFFTRRHWSKIPPSWRDSLESMTPSDMAQWMEEEGEAPRPRSGGPFPLELLALRLEEERASIALEKRSQHQ